MIRRHVATERALNPGRKSPPGHGGGRTVINEAAPAQTGSLIPNLQPHLCRNRVNTSSATRLPANATFIMGCDAAITHRQQRKPQLSSLAAPQ